jgi:hypothetical protein
MKQYNLKLTPEISYIVGTLLGDGNNDILSHPKGWSILN